MKGRRTVVAGQVSRGPEAPNVPAAPCEHHLGGKPGHIETSWGVLVVYWWCIRCHRAVAQRKEGPWFKTPCDLATAQDANGMPEP